MRAGRWSSPFGAGRRKCDGDFWAYSIVEGKHVIKQFGCSER
jgi:hypothetical protein